MDQTFQPFSIENLPNSASFEKPQAKLYNQIQTQGKKSFQCLVTGCEKIYKYKSDMERHVLIHMKEKPILCPYPSCNKSFKRPDALRNHMQTRHIINKTFVCPLPDCGVQTHDKLSFQFHLIKHQGLQFFASKSPDDGKIYVPWKKNSEWERKWWAKHKADFAQGRNYTIRELLPESVLHQMSSDWDRISEDAVLPAKFYEQVELLMNKDFPTFSRDPLSDTLSMGSFRDESPCLIPDARDLLRSICKQLAEERQENKEK